MRPQPFERLLSNVKGLIDIELGPCTVIVGANFVGKTSVLDTIRLAVTGKHPVGAHPRDLVELLPDGADHLYATLQGPSGVLSWRMDVVEGRARRSKGVSAQGAFVGLSDDERASILVLDSGDLDGLGTERMRRAVMERFGALQSVPTPAGLNSTQTRWWNQAAAASPQGDAAARLVAMQTWLKRQAKEKGDLASAKATVIETLRQHVSGAGGVDVIMLLEEQVTKAREARRQQDLRTRIDDVNKQLEAVGDACQVEAIREAQEEHKRLLTQAQTVVKLLERAAHGACPCCGSEDADVTDSLERARASVESHTRRLDELRLAREAADRRAKLLADIERLQAELVPGCPPEYTGPSIEDLEQKLAAARDAQSSAARIRGEEDTLQRLLDDQATLKLLERQTVDILSTHLKSVADSASAAVNKYMPEGFQAVLRVTDSVCQWRMLGKDGRSHKTGAYSGSEGASLALARAQAWAEGAPFRLVLQDDVDLGVYDPQQLTSVFRKLHESVQAGLLDQVVLVWNRPDEVPTDGSWHVVNLGDRSLC